MREKHHILRNDSHMRLLFKFDDSTDLLKNYAKNPLAGNVNTLTFSQTTDSKFGRGAINNFTGGDENWESDNYFDFNSTSWLFSYHVWQNTYGEYWHFETQGQPRFQVINYNGDIWFYIKNNSDDVGVVKFDESILPLNQWNNVIFAFHKTYLYGIINRKILFKKTVDEFMGAGNLLPNAIIYLELGHRGSGLLLDGKLDEFIFKTNLDIDINQLTQVQKKGSL